jgi:GDP/UDP-N,N'-diacetylbacillosamine 2-epimerase (hydrolysing)
MGKNPVIAVVTGTRAEFGLLLPVIKRIEAHAGLALSLIVTGAHLCESLGGTVKEIERAGVPIAKRIDILPDGERTKATEAAAVALREFSRYFSETKPDVVVVLGDRYEIFAATAAAAMCDIPVAHISGGETTEGAKDEFFRHCITKMSALHFASTDAYRKRIIQLGEQPENVYFAGSLGAENIKTLPVIPREELSREIGFDVSHDFLLCTYHPETLCGVSPKEGAAELLAALDAAGLPVLFTAANADDGGREINEAIRAYCEKRENARLVDSLGAVRYLSAMRYCKAVIGNSSSAIVESPTLKKPAVNIGERQTGRIKGENNIDCATERGAIAAAIKKAVSTEFQTSVENMESPYGRGGASEVIVGAIEERVCSLTTKKTFYDVDFEVK